MSSARAVVVLLLALWCCPVRADTKEEQIAYFEQHIRPLLVNRCLECHSEKSDSIGGNLVLDHRAGWIAGGDLGPSIVPGQPDESLLIKAVRQDGDELQMPPDGRLSASEIRHLENWIRQGAVDPRRSEGSSLSRNVGIDLEQGRTHWAFQPLQPVRLPTLTSPFGDWARNEIDLLVAAKHAQLGLTPVAATDRATLIRRATFDLLGVPPSPEEVDRFLADRSPLAYERLIDRLLASPRYGERWGRHWLDVARYADSNGLDENAAHANAWRYRDYVIACLNQDLAFDQFVVEQLAGDQMESEDDALRRRRVVATGMLVLGPKVLAEGDEKKMEMDIIDEQIETVGRAFMGLTLGCARCHDHKFDPISTQDYYALAGIFGSTQTMVDYKRIAKWNETSVATPEQVAEHARQSEDVAAAKKNVDEFIVQANKELLSSLQDGAKLPAKPEEHYDESTKAELARLRALHTDLAASIKELPSAMAVVDREQPADQPVLIRGSHLTPAEPVDRGFPTVLVSHQHRESFAIPPGKSGRLQLARWMTDRRHPLASRVMVNRVWRWHFGRGISPSTDNFGLLGESPSNPELLDWLAGQFMADGWSVKKLHRRIMLSATYRLSSTDHAKNAEIDPENISHWRCNTRRLEAEEMLDSLHAVSGLLDFQMGGSLLKTENRVLVFNHTSEDKTTYEVPRRAVYLPVIRNHLADVFQLFDYSEASVMTSDRPSTTVAPQALFLMNSETANRAAANFASRLMREESLTDSQRLDYAYRLAFGRPISNSERQRGLKYLAAFEQAGDDTISRVEAWQLLCQTLLAANEFCYVR